MTEIRVVGVLVGVVLAGGGLYARKRRSATRGELLAWLALGCSVAVLSIAPGTSNLLASLLGLENRLFAVLVAAVLLLFGLYLASTSRVHKLERRIGDLVRSLAVRQFWIEHEKATDDRAIAIVIPAFDEEEAIAGVLKELPQEVEGHRVEPIVVVDGGDDGTEGVVRRAGYLVATHPINRGQGDALRTGFDIALRRGAQIVVTMDADGQHRPDQLSELVKPIVTDEADYVQGSRFLGDYDEAGSARSLGIRIFTRLINLLSDAGITDCTNGFRAIRADKLASMQLEEDRFSAPEIIIQAASRRLRIREVPIHVRARSHGRSKKPARLGYPLGFLRALLKSWLKG